MTAAAPASDRTPPSWGGPLNENDYAALEASWITREIADQAMLRRVDAVEGRAIVGQKGSRDCAGTLIPYYWPGDPGAVNYRIRRDNPEWKFGKDGKPKPDRRYLGPPNSANRLYIPPGVTPEQLEDATIPTVVVEGEKKGMALWRLANHEAGTPRFIPIAIAGVWNWRGVVGKTGGPNGERVDVKGPIFDLDRVAWKGRKAFIVFDTNVHTNDQVKWARKGIARELAKRGADVPFVDLPEDCGVNGIDDLLAAWGPARVLELFEKPVAGARLDIVLPPQFESRPEGMFRFTTRGAQQSQVQLSNYRAAITANIRLDDGVETRREFEIDSELMGRPFRFTVSASEFARMDWPIEQMGASAITFPTQRDYARTAIQSCSMAAAERCIYTHTGWRLVDGRWIFLHAGGAIGGAGAVTDVSVRLLGPMTRYELPIPAGPEDLIAAVKASLRLTELGPAAIAFPLLAATYRAVFGDADFALHLAGETGAFKSEIAALHQQHFGATMDRLRLPGTWSSTGNALEAMAFHAKDSLFVIDDFAPQGSQVEVARYNAAADRVFRAAGNHAGRGRLDSTTKLREPKPPRALILSTGEDIPRGQSIRARMLILDLPTGAINTDALTECQKDAVAGLYAQAMSGFLQWIAGRYDDIVARFKERCVEVRTWDSARSGHARTPEIIANLQAGFDVFLEFAQQSGAVDATNRQRLAERCWDALDAAADAQAKHVAAADPAERFVSLLRACLSSGQAHLASRDGSAPTESPQGCGWRVQGGNWTAQGHRVGWVDGADLYLEPVAAYQVVQLACRSGEALALSEQMLRKLLRQRGFLATTDQKRETLTVRRTICGSKKDVLHFLRNTLFPDAAEGEDGDVG